MVVWKWENLFYLVQNNNFFQISPHIHKNWLTYQMDGADFKYEVKNCVIYTDVEALLPQQRCRRYVMTYSSFNCSDHNTAANLLIITYIKNSNFKWGISQRLMKLEKWKLASRVNKWWAFYFWWQLKDMINGTWPLSTIFSTSYLKSAQSIWYVSQFLCRCREIWKICCFVLNNKDFTQMRWMAWSTHRQDKTSWELNLARRFKLKWWRNINIYLIEYGCVLKPVNHFFRWYCSTKYRRLCFISYESMKCQKNSFPNLLPYITYDFVE